MEKESIKKNKTKEKEKGDEERKKKTRIKRESTLYKVRKLTYTRHARTYRLSYSVRSLLHVDQMTTYYSPLTPAVSSAKNTGTRREIARVPHESSFISCYAG